MYLQILEPEGAKDDVVEMKEEETEDAKKVEKAEHPNTLKTRTNEIRNGN